MKSIFLSRKKRPVCVERFMFGTKKKLKRDAYHTPLTVLLNFDERKEKSPSRVQTEESDENNSGRIKAWLAWVTQIGAAGRLAGIFCI